MEYFITENYLKDKTPITRNVDSGDIMPFVETASDMWVQDILGSYFYFIILDKFNDMSLGADEIVLVNLIKPVVAWRAGSDAVYGVHYALRNKGIQVQNGENSDAAIKDEVVMMKRHYDQKAEFYEERLRRYLVLNKNKFSDFTNKLNTNSCLTDITPSNDSGYNNDWFSI